MSTPYASDGQASRRKKASLRSDAKGRRPWTYRCSSDTAYRMPMSDASQPREDWAGYLRRMTDRPGWSVARLAREAGINRGTIFKWMKGGAGVNVNSVRAIAKALDDNVENALRAAGDAEGQPEKDEEVALIMRAPVDDELKQTMLGKLYERRERDRLERLADFQAMIDVAPKQPEVG